MKFGLLGLALTLSFSVFASSVLEDQEYLSNCGGSVELRSHIDGQGQERFALQFRGVSKCSNVILSSGESYKLTDGQGNFQDRNYTLSNEASEAAKSYYGLGLTLQSNSGATSDELTVNVSAPSYAPAPIPSGDYEPTSW